jgi:hypothetical protein
MMKKTIKITVAASLILLSSGVYAKDATNERIKVSVSTPTTQSADTFLIADKKIVDHGYDIDKGMVFIGYSGKSDSDWGYTDQAGSLPWYCFGGAFCENTSSNTVFGKVTEGVGYLVVMDEKTKDIYVKLSLLNSFESSASEATKSAQQPEVKSLNTKNIQFSYGLLSNTRQCKTMDDIEVCITNPNINNNSQLSKT